MPEIQNAEIDDEGTVHLEIGGAPFAFYSPDRIHAPGPGDAAYRLGRPGRPNPTKWPPVVTYVIGPGDVRDGGLLGFDLRDLMTVELEDVETLVSSICDLPWATDQRPELWLTIQDAATRAEMVRGLRAQMGSAMPEIHVETQPIGDDGPMSDGEPGA